MNMIIGPDMFDPMRNLFPLKDPTPVDSCSNNTGCSNLGCTNDNCNDDLCGDASCTDTNCDCA